MLNIRRSTKTRSARAVRRRIASIAGVIALAMVATACAAVPVTAFTRTGATVGNPATAVEWFASPAPNGREVRLALLRAQGDGPHPALLILPGSDGLTDTYIKLARDFAAQGFDVAAGCWFGLPNTTSLVARIDCDNAPDFTGVSEASVGAVQALVDATLEATGVAPDQLGILGYSRGGGAALLRSARTGAEEPIVDLAGMVTGQVLGSPLPTDVNVIPSATSISAPTLMLHGTSDSIVVPTQTTTLASAMRSAKRDVTVHWYTTECDGACNHNLLAFTQSRKDVIERASAWLHRQLS
ncbi:unannotated protein [freshwater metagenome]|uniref:Unannotated protein n=1 Tax=freshwater metagenome TaxID=449393 RepID=A0A6J7JX60_9ZZZZ|nr:prolyl oligopeptidase family serine peptidase [Actinomycetota bacterium]